MKKNVKLLLLAFICALPIFAQNNSDSNFQLITENRDLPTFENIQVTGRFTVVLTQSETQQVSVTVPDKFLETVETKVEGGILYINMVDLKKEQKDAGIFESLKTKYNDYLLRQPIEVRINVTNLKSISARGASRVESRGALSYNKFLLDFQGASKAELNIKANTVDVFLTEAVKIDIVGTTDQVYVKANGACSFMGVGLHSKKATVELAGASRAEVHATESFDANLTGATKVVCTGSPKNIKQYASRGSSITVK